MSEPLDPRRADDPPPPEPPTTLWSPAPFYEAPSYEAPTYPAVDPYPGAALPVPYPPPPAAYPVPTSYPPGYGYQLVAPAGTYGFDPVTGQALSPKSKMTAGLLQLLPAIFFSFGGIGRLYAGNTTIGVLQAVASVVGWVAFWCGLTLNILVLFLPLVLYVGLWLWFVIDGIMMLAGRPVDGEGRLLRS